MKELPPCDHDVCPPTRCKLRSGLGEAKRELYLALLRIPKDELRDSPDDLRLMEVLMVDRQIQEWIESR